MIKELSISGLRGFGEEQTISFSIPDGVKEGSGLTVITGANNSGKTTIIEAIRSFNGAEAPSFSEGKRNKNTKGTVKLTLKDEKEKNYTIETNIPAGSTTHKNEKFNLKFYVVQSRRAFGFEFSKTTTDKEYYISNTMGMDSQRSSTLTNYTYRIFQINENRERFDQLLNRLLGKDFQWVIEQRDNGQYYIKYSNNGFDHSAEGIGDGIWGIFTICAALFDAEDNSVVVIDEPELSLHPSLQKRLLKVLLEYSKKVQIIICTHSPYFISWDAISNGAGFIRTVKENNCSLCYTLKESRHLIKKCLEDINNPHVFGIEANEVFFLEDRIILVEGQEDVVIYNKIAEQVDTCFNGEFYGWGVGGAPKMSIFLALFRELGYKKVVAIFDGDKKSDKETLEEQYPDYHFVLLKEDDIRDKKERTINKKNGITDISGNLKELYFDYAKNMINEVNSYLR